MIESVILDTGPLVAALDSCERHHTWLVNQLQWIKPPLITNEAVLTEATYPLRKKIAGIQKIYDYLSLGVIEVQFCLKNHFSEVF